MVESSSLSGFACPQESFDEEVFSGLVREYARTLASLLLDRYREGIADNPDCLSAILDLPSAAGYRPYWSPALGQCLAALQTGDVRVAQRGLAQVLLNASRQGAPCDWRIQLAEPSSFHWDFCLLPEADCLEVHSTGREALIRVDNRERSHTFDFTRSDTSTKWQGTTGREIAHVERGDFNVMVLSDSDVRELRLPIPAFPVLDEVSSAQTGRLLDCIRFVDDHVPGYTRWIERVQGHLVLVRSEEDRMLSGNFPGYFAYTYASDLGDPLKMGEMLIHESSHQYFNLLARLGDLVEDDGRVFYSPFVRTERPADRILLAYHAFANVELFYRICADEGVKIDQCRRALACTVPDVDALERVLASEVQLTSLGISIFQPLREHRSAYAELN